MSSQLNTTVWMLACALLASVALLETLHAQSNCVDSQMKAIVACPPSGSPPPAMKDGTEGGVRNEPPGSNAGCGRGLGFCCFCHTSLAAPVQASRELAPALRTSPPPFWERHTAIARLLPRNAMNRTIKTVPQLREPYVTLMKSRTSR